MAMRLYEGMWLLDSAQASKDLEGALTHVRDLLEKQSAEIMRLERWDDRRLAYEIKGARRGTYILAHFRAEPTTIDKLRRDCQLSERVLRFLPLQDDELLERVAEREALQKKREAEAAKAIAEGLDTGRRRKRDRRGRPGGD